MVDLLFYIAFLLIVAFSTFYALKEYLNNVKRFH